MRDLMKNYEIKINFGLWTNELGVIECIWRYTTEEFMKNLYKILKNDCNVIAPSAM